MILCRYFKIKKKLNLNQSCTTSAKFQIIVASVPSEKFEDLFICRIIIDKQSLLKTDSDGESQCKMYTH